MMNLRQDLHIDVTAMAALVALTAIGVAAIMHGDGETVAAAAVGAIGGWMARGGGKTTTTTDGDPPTKTTIES